MVIQTAPHRLGTIIEAGVDYLTCTWPLSPRGTAAWQTGERLVAAEVEAGNKARPWLFYGYLGSAAGRAAVGRRHDGTILRLSSQLADEHYRKAVASGGKPSRLDLQVTLRFTPEAKALAHQGYILADAHNTTVAQPLTLSLVRDNRGGSTLYLGSRASDRFARLYNKEAESKEAHYERCWRYEVEYKADRAVACAQQLAASSSPGSTVASTVHDHFNERGVPCPWQRPGDALHLELPHHRTDDERTLAWLHEQVRPVLARLLLRHSRHGLLTQLGLSSTVSP